MIPIYLLIRLWVYNNPELLRLRVGGDLVITKHWKNLNIVTQLPSATKAANTVYQPNAYHIW